MHVCLLMCVCAHLSVILLETSDTPGAGGVSFLSVYWESNSGSPHKSYTLLTTESSLQSQYWTVLNSAPDLG